MLPGNECGIESALWVTSLRRSVATERRPCRRFCRVNVTATRGAVRCRWDARETLRPHHRGGSATGAASMARHYDGEVSASQEWVERCLVGHVFDRRSVDSPAGLHVGTVGLVGVNVDG